MPDLDPYSDRLARDIRNSLSTAFVEELTGKAQGALSGTADAWLETVSASIYQAYIEDRMALYRQAADEMKSGGIVDARYQAICLWNLGLYFEMHELLETIWLRSRDPERSALKGWIQAAGVYVHFRRGKKAVARSLAKRAAVYLNSGRDSLRFIANLDQIIDALSDPADTPPRIVPA